MAADVGLGNQAILTRIDRLRELNVGAIIPLPQLAVVGDQSSGKSSVLESLTGFSFPRAAGLCTRYVTQITCSRDSKKSVSIAIIPRPDADDALKAKIQKFQRRIVEINNEDLANIFQDANRAMGIRITTSDETPGLQSFSQDILKIEISGPDQEHFTVIDIPGIFRVPTPGLTTDTDITLVRNMVKQYMLNSRTIILAAMPCNVDIANQEILKLAEEVDPNGGRTMGVLTKPDLANEKAMHSAVVDLISGTNHALKLGYFAVKNRSADDEHSTLVQRLEDEKAFFISPHWSAVNGRCGIPALKHRIRHLLMDISKREMPHVKSDVEGRLRRCRADLDSMGPSRADASSQRLYLGKLASRYQAVTQSALNAYYLGEPLFKSQPKLKLMTRLVKLNEIFADGFWKKGHLQYFDSAWDNEGETCLGDSEDLSGTEAEPKLEDYTDRYAELLDIVETEEYDCPKPRKGPLLDRIGKLFESSRGPEIGTFNGTILASIFEEQSEKWEPLVRSHASKAIAMVHDYNWCLLSELCRDTHVRAQLWNTLVDQICAAYRRAMEHACFLLSVERKGRPTTFNHYFNSILQKKRSARVENAVTPYAKEYTNGKGKYVDMDHIKNYAQDKSNHLQVCEDILDTVTSYYKVSRKRFVDSVCQQVVLHFLLDCDDSPLKILSPEFVMGLETGQLEVIAGEDVESKRQREVLTRDIKNLEAALKVLRT